MNLVFILGMICVTATAAQVQYPLHQPLYPQVQYPVLPAGYSFYPSLNPTLPTGYPSRPSVNPTLPAGYPYFLNPSVLPTGYPVYPSFAGHRDGRQEGSEDEGKAKAINTGSGSATAGAEGGEADATIISSSLFPSFRCDPFKHGVCGPNGETFIKLLND